jgi:hypothetical protein
MTVRTEVRSALEGLAGDQVFPVVAPEGTLPPYVVFQIVGGDPQESLSGEKPAKKLRRVQVSVWAKASLEAEAIAIQAEDALRARPDLQVEVLTEAIDDFDEVTKYRGTRQDFYLFC